MQSHMCLGAACRAGAQSAAAKGRQAGRPRVYMRPAATAGRKRNKMHAHRVVAGGKSRSTMRLWRSAQKPCVRRTRRQQTALTQTNDDASHVRRQPVQGSLCSIGVWLLAGASNKSGRVRSNRSPIGPISKSQGTRSTRAPQNIAPRTGAAATTTLLYRAVFVVVVVVQKHRAHTEGTRNAIPLENWPAPGITRPGGIGTLFAHTGGRAATEGTQPSVCRGENTPQPAAARSLGPTAENQSVIKIGKPGIPEKGGEGGGTYSHGTQLQRAAAAKGRRPATP